VPSVLITGAALASLPPLCSKLHGDVGVHSQTSLEHRQWRWSLDVVVARSVIAGGSTYCSSSHGPFPSFPSFPRLGSARKFHLASHATLHCTVRTMVYLGSRYVFDIARIFPISGAGRRWSIIIAFFSLWEARAHAWIVSLSHTLIRGFRGSE